MAKNLNRDSRPYMFSEIIEHCLLKACFGNFRSEYS